MHLCHGEAVDSQTFVIITMHLPGKKQVESRFLVTFFMMRELSLSIAFSIAYTTTSTIRCTVSISISYMPGLSTVMRVSTIDPCSILRCLGIFLASVWGFRGQLDKMGFCIMMPPCCNMSRKGYQLGPALLLPIVKGHHGILTITIEPAASC